MKNFRRKISNDLVSKILIEKRSIQNLTKEQTVAVKKH